MKKNLISLLQQALDELKAKNSFPADITPTIINIERTKNPLHGDFSSNLALVLADSANINARNLAIKIINALPKDPMLDQIDVAGPGFINFFVKSATMSQIIQQINEQGQQYGRSQLGKGKKIQVEFVSANPTGPLHVGHGRGAVYGSVVANMLEAVGFDVVREYYVNDAGRQMDILAVSIWLRYLEHCGEVIIFPSNGYQGEYIKDIAAEIYSKSSNLYYFSIEQVLAYIGLNPPTQDSNKETYIDALIARAKKLLGRKKYKHIFQVGLNNILHNIRQDLCVLGIEYQQWFRESYLIDNGLIDVALQGLDNADYLYQSHGATWFKSSTLGDVKDRVVVRDNGQTTYFASDIAYHINKFKRGFDKIINVWGADHHGYIPRVKAALLALKEDTNRLDVLLVQFAVLYRGDKKIPMSTRSGEFVALRQLYDEVGKDALRFFYVMRRSEQHMDFDLELAKAKTNENPVFYVQYAHARICSVLHQLNEKDITRDLQCGMQYLNLLTTTHETNLIMTLSSYPELVERAAVQNEPHQLVHYLRGLANEFHTYYNDHQFLVEDVFLRNARINLICAVKQCLANGLGLLGISAPEAM